MADLSKIILPNNSELTLKDNSQEHSAHTHYDSDLVPLIHKKYESTSYYGTTNDWENTTWYFMSVVPDDWNKPWRVRFKVHSYCPKESGGVPAYPTYHSYTWTTMTGRMNAWSYCNWNERNNSAHTYITVYSLKQAGFEAGYGHAIGVSIYNADYRTNANYYRTFEVDYYDCENCTVTILDTPVKWSNWTGASTTNYENIANSNAVDRGMCETNDLNDGHYYERRVYSNIKAGPNGIFPYTLIMQNSDDRWESLVTSSTTATTKTKNSHGFRLGQILYNQGAATYAENTIPANYSIEEGRGNVFDHRYSFNTANNATDGLTANLPVYLVGTLGNDGLFYLADKWWSQTLPTTEDGKLYIRLGDDFDYYRMCFDIKHPIYRYVNGKLREYADDAATVNGHSVAKDVPSDAKFTDTTYTFANGDDSFSVTPSGGSAQTVKVNPYHLKNTDNRNDNQLPSWYMTNHPRSTIQEFKSCSAIGVNSLITSAFCILTTTVPWTDNSGGLPIQLAVSNTGVRAQRVATAADAWSSWVQLPNTAKIDNGTITIDGNSITPLTTTSNVKEAYLEWGGKNFSGSFGCIDAAMVDELGANRFMFLRAAGITVEYTRDGGTTWLDYGATDTQKVALFSVGQSFVIGKADTTDKATTHGTDYQLRVTINTGGTAGCVYTQLNKFVLNISTGGSSSCKVTIQKAKEATPDTYEEVVTDIPINGWSGYNVVNVPAFTTYGNTASTQYGRVRFIFTANGGDTNYTGLSIIKIMGFGGMGWTTPSNMAKTGHLYAFDASQKATFPAGMQINGNVLIASGVTGEVMLNGNNNTKAGIRLSESGKNMDIGWDWNAVAGSGAYFRSATHSAAGRFGFYARSSSGTVQLIGDTNGSLTWNNKRVVTATNSTQIGSATKPVYVNSSGYVTECSVEINTQKIFVDTVTTPYAVGDVWLGSDGTFQCIDAKASGDFDIEDWEEIPNGYLNTEEVSALIAQATQIITAGGSIIWNDANSDGKYDEVLWIRNDTDPSVPVTIDNATSVYKFDNNGLSHSSTGYRGTYKQILDANGNGIADFLQSGTLDASKVTIANFNSSMITAGLLKRGGSDNQFGAVEVYNNSGVLIGTVDKNGIKMYGPGNIGQRSYVVMNDIDIFAGYDANNTQLFKITGDVFNFKKIAISDEVKVCGKLNFIPITITENNTVVNDGIAIVGLV